MFPQKRLESLKLLDTKNEYDDLDKKNISLDARAINILYCVFDRGEFNIISSCGNARDIWYVLVITQEGIRQVKE